jgi:transcriptional regulator with XRE-family HTH domain
LASDKEKVAFIRRLEIAAKRVGSFYALAKQLGVTEQTLHNYRTRGSDPSRRMLIQIAAATGVSVEWLATGKDPVGRLDPSRLHDVVETVEALLEMTDRELTPRSKAEMIATIYEQISQEESGIVQPKKPRTERITTLADRWLAVA